MFPRPMYMVKFVPDERDAPNQYPFKEKHPYLYFGEIQNMLGHCVVMDHVTGEIFSGFHVDNFDEIDEEFDTWF